MVQIKLSPEELRTSATKYTAGSEEVTQVLTSLRSEQETIRANWEGHAFDSFDEQFNELAPKIEAFAQLLQDIQTQLNVVADSLEETDNALAGRR